LHGVSLFLIGYLWSAVENKDKPARSLTSKLLFKSLAALTNDYQHPYQNICRLGRPILVKNLSRNKIVEYLLAVAKLKAFLTRRYITLNLLS